jgi:preprotein translocase subunit SecD
VADRAPANGEPAVGSGVPARVTGLLFVLVLVAFYYRRLIDDAFISFRYTRSLLWVLILAVGMRLGGDPT